MTETIEKIDRETFEQLAPWYVSGRLAGAERKSMDAFLQDNPEYEKHIELTRSELDETIKANEMLGAPSPAALDRLMQDIAAEPKTSESFLSWLNGVFDPFWNLLGDMRPVAAMAAAVVIMIQAIAIGSLVSHDAGGEKTYNTATGPESKKGTYILVQFTKNVSLSQMSDFLDERQWQVTEGPLSSRMFRVRIAEGTLDEAKKAEILRNLKAKSEIVQSVLPAP